MCRFGLRHPKTTQFLKEPTWWLSTSPEMIQQLSRLCEHDHEHDECMGGNVCGSAAIYQPALAKAILKGLEKTLDRKDHQRLQALMRAVAARIRGAGVRAPVEQTMMLQSLRKGDKAREVCVSLPMKELRSLKLEPSLLLTRRSLVSCRSHCCKGCE